MTPEELRRAREGRGMSQNHLAALSGVAQATVSLIERGLIKASPDILAKLEKGLATGGFQREPRAKKPAVVVKKRKRTPPEMYPVEAGCVRLYIAVFGEEVPIPEELDDVVKGVLAALMELSLKERWVLRLRYGISRRKETLREIADRIGLTPERIRQMEMRALTRMRNPRRLRLMKNPDEVHEVVNDGPNMQWVEDNWVNLGSPYR